MQLFETKPKQWGNSLGITIPREIVRKQHLSGKKEVMVLILPLEKQGNIRKAFGSLKCTKSTQQIMDEIDEGYD